MFTFINVVRPVYWYVYITAEKLQYIWLMRDTCKDK